MFEIRWIDDSKRYGLFATQQIDRSTDIFHESAVIRDISGLAAPLDLWNRISTEEVFLHQTTMNDIQTQTQQILYGMQDLENKVKTSQKYEAAMKIHRARIESGNAVEIYEPGVCRPISHVPISFYKRAIGLAEDAVSSVLEKSLSKINTYLQGMVGVRSLDAQPEYLTAWGPHSSLMNHGCKPNAVASCFTNPNSGSTSSRNIGVIALRSLAQISAGEEITIEYVPSFGSFDTRRKQLRSIGIANCHCRDCDYEESLSLQLDNVVAQQKLTTLSDMSRTLFRVKYRVCPNIKNLSPASVYRHLYQAFDSMSRYEYYGVAIPYFAEVAMEYAKHHNDNIRAYWFAHWLIAYSGIAYGKDHPSTKRLNAHVEAALSNRVWSEKKKDLLVLCQGYTFTPSDADPMFMLDRDPETCNIYPQLTIQNGRPVPTSYEANLAHVKASISQQQPHHTKNPAAEQLQEQEQQKQARAAADRAAAELAASEDREAARKTKAKLKKKQKQTRQKEKKRRAAEESEQQARQIQTAIEQRLAARIAAIRAADTVPALPRPRLLPHPVQVEAEAPTPAPTPTPTTPDHPAFRLRFRSFSTPEPATINRFLSGAPLRQPPSAYKDEDCVSESGLEIRFGVSVGVGIDGGDAQEVSIGH